MQQSPTLALFNVNDSPLESGFINKNQRLKKNGTTVLAVLRKIADGGEKWAEPGTSRSKCKKLIHKLPKVVGINSSNNYATVSHFRLERKGFEPSSGIIA